MDRLKRMEDSLGIDWESYPLGRPNNYESKEREWWRRTFDVG